MQLSFVGGSRAVIRLVLSWEINNISIYKCYCLVKYHSRADRLVSEHLRMEKQVESSHIVPLLLWCTHQVLNHPKMN